ncbi:MAG TPA: class I SAM-dependent methyltransferase [Bryobacteraceae bacterium]|jgi:SAM-dependent methyltransferase
MTLEAQARVRFLNEYRQIRYDEGRGSDDPAYYRALPYRDLTGRNSAMWEMRAKTYRYFERRILAVMERHRKRPLDILDLGAGNGWMSYRLALRNHRPVALDIFSDTRDGLLAARHYPPGFSLLEADFGCLPFEEGSFDVAIFNSSFHYSTDYAATLAEVRRCLRPSGAVVILDSPVYRRREDGERMASERHRQFAARYGFASDAIPSIEFLDEPMLRQLAATLKLRWRIWRPWYGWRWHLRPLRAWLRGGRPPSRFWILVGEFGLT